ncbi:MAG: hypothetical protein AABX71_01100 [Nanoarchaeota archaeon]
MKILIALIMFLFLAAFFIISENKLVLKNSEARQEFQKLYFSWMNNIFEDAKNLTSYVVKLDWLPEVS